MDDFQAASFRGPRIHGAIPPERRWLAAIAVGERDFSILDGDCPGQVKVRSPRSAPSARRVCRLSGPTRVHQIRVHRIRVLSLFS